jgi:hypothetical protein
VEEAWSLLTATMLSALFKTMSAARAEAGDKPEDDLDLNSRAAKVFWGELGSATVLWRSYFRLVFASIRACSIDLLAKPLLRRLTRWLLVWPFWKSLPRTLITGLLRRLIIFSAQCHRVMVQLLQLGFRRHPCVLPALTLHCFARKTSSSEVNKIIMAARLVVLEKSNKDSDHGVTQKAYYLFCSRTVEPLAKRIKALESKA